MQTNRIIKSWEEIISESKEPTIPNVGDIVNTREDNIELVHSLHVINEYQRNLYSIFKEHTQSNGYGEINANDIEDLLSDAEQTYNTMVEDGNMELANAFTYFYTLFDEVLTHCVKEFDRLLSIEGKNILN